jgi:hypothetical protein
MLSGDSILVQGPDHIVYCVQSAGHLLGRLNRYIKYIGINYNIAYKRYLYFGIPGVSVSRSIFQY